MFEMALNSIKKTKLRIIGNPILPYFAHKCALLSLPSYDTTIGPFVKIKNDFKRIKRYPLASFNSTECQRDRTMRKLSKIALFIFGFYRLLSNRTQEFKKYLKIKIFRLHSLQSALQSSITVRNGREPHFPIIALQGFIL